MKKVKVAVPVISKNSNWLGGYNYIINLLNALSELEELRIEVVLLASQSSINELKQKYSKFKFKSTSLNTPFGLIYWISRIFGKFFNNYFLYELNLKFAGLNFIAYGPSLFKSNNICSISWIPDFQHLYYPDFFSKKEIAHRNYVFTNYIKNSTLIIVSSKTAKNDIGKFNFSALRKTRILSFASSKSIDMSISSFENIRNKYKLPKLFFHLPNHFWVHKNHKLVAEAIYILNKKNINYNIVCTGNTFDYREPDFFNKFVTSLKYRKIEKQFFILGVVPYQDVISLMKNSVCVINPSLFEGWSTTVEESKSLDKRILLSDIPVHREQNPRRGIFFDPKSAFNLAEKMEECFSEKKNKLKNQKNNANVEKEVKKKIKNFAINFEDIVLEASKIFNNR